MTLLDWIVFAFCCSLPFALWAIRRWQIRVRLVKDFSHADTRLVRQEFPVGASEAEDSSQREHVCECGIECPHAVCVCVICGESFPNQERSA